ncbi:MAG: hypothetical protein WBQ86_01685 [Candidatus Binatus sp.]
MKQAIGRTKDLSFEITDLPVHCARPEIVVGARPGAIVKHVPVQVDLHSGLVRESDRLSLQYAPLERRIRHRRARLLDCEEAPHAPRDSRVCRIPSLANQQRDRAQRSIAMDQYINIVQRPGAGVRIKQEGERNAFKYYRIKIDSPEAREDRFERPHLKLISEPSMAPVSAQHVRVSSTQAHAFQVVGQQGKKAIRTLVASLYINRTAPPMPGVDSCIAGEKRSLEQQ